MSNKAPDIIERLTPKHLQEEMPKTAEEIKKDIQQEASGEKQAKRDPKMDKHYAFSINWEDGQGHLWKGDFVNKILSIRERQMVGVMRARLGNALPADALDPLTQEINLMVAHLSFSLEEKPEWAEDLFTLEHIALLQTIYMEVMAHEGMFLGRETFNG